MDQKTALEHTADRDTNSLTVQVLRMHDRDHAGSAKFCEQAECCQTAYRYDRRVNRDRRVVPVAG